MPDIRKEVKYKRQNCAGRLITLLLLSYLRDSSKVPKM